MHLPGLLVFFVTVCLSASNNIYNCPDGYTRYSYYDSTSTNYNYACYKVFITYYTRQAAEARCAQDGAFLPSIINTYENQVFTNSDPYSGSLFIGLSCYDENNCAFDDGTPFNTTSFKGFKGGQIRYDLGECVALETIGAGKGNWSNIPCSMVGSFVCKYVPDSRIALTTGCNAHYDIDSWPITITSPFYPNHYQTYMTCVYSFSRNLNITFLDFQLYNNYDFVRIYDGGLMIQNQTLLGTYTGSVYPPATATTSGSGMIIFQSGYYGSSNRGFKAVLNYA